MAQLIYNIPDEKIDQIAEDWIYLYPNVNCYNGKKYSINLIEERRTNDTEKQ